MDKNLLRENFSYTSLYYNKNSYIYTIYLQDSIRCKQINGITTPKRSQKFWRTYKGDQKSWTCRAHSTWDAEKHKLLVSLTVYKGEVSKLGQGRKICTNLPSVSITIKIKTIYTEIESFWNLKTLLSKDLFIKITFRHTELEQKLCHC